MRPVAVVAAGAISALGRGREAFSVGSAGEPAYSRIRVDAELEAFGLRRPLAARVELVGAEPSSDRAQELLRSAARDLAHELDQLLPDWRSRRVGLALGTSGGGLPSLERA